MLNDIAREQIRQAAQEELRRNPPPPASPELVAKLAAIFAGAQVPDMATAGLSDPAVTDTEPHPLQDEKKSDAQGNAA